MWHQLLHPSDSTAIWVLAHDVRADVRADGGVVFDLKHGRCHCVNALGAFVWRLLDNTGGLSLEALCEATREKTSNAPPSLRDDIARFLNRLNTIGLVRRSHCRGISRVSVVEEAADDPRCEQDTIASKPSSEPFHNSENRRAPLSFIVAYTFLIACDLALRMGGIRGLRATIHLASRVACVRLSAAHALELAKVVNDAAAYYYKHTWCLHRAAATSCFLRLHGIPAEVVIGYCPMPFYSHAWVEVESVVVAERPRIKALLRVISRF